MVYPTLLAAISDVAHPSWRASGVGVYRLWRDTGFAVGALLAGLVAAVHGTGAGEAKTPSRAALASPRPPPSRQPAVAMPGRATAPAVGGRLVAGMLGLGLGGGHPQVAAPAAPATARLVRVTTPPKIQHQERDRGRAVGLALRLGDQATRDG